MIRVLAAALSLALAFSGWQYHRAEILSRDLDATDIRFEQCNTLLTATLEGEEIDDAIPDDLDGFDVPPEWLLGD